MSLLSMRALSLSPLFFFTLALRAQAPADVSGTWKGTLAVGAQSLHLQLHLKAGEAGSGGCTLDSLDQGASAIPCELTVTKTAVDIDVPAVHGKYHGTLASDGNTLKGTWTQGMDLPLDFTRETPAK